MRTRTGAWFLITVLSCWHLASAAMAQNQTSNANNVTINANSAISPGVTISSDTNNAPALTIDTNPAATPTPSATPTPLPITVDNAGTIVNTDNGNLPRVAVLAIGDGAVTINNNGTGVITGNVVLTGRGNNNSTITNNGAITGTIFNSGNQNVSVINNGTFKSDDAGDGRRGVAIDTSLGGNSSDSVTANSNISGSIDLGNGNNSLTVGSSAKLDSTGNAAAVRFGAGGTINNSGTISQSNGDDDDAVSITAQSNATAINNFASARINSVQGNAISIQDAQRRVTVDNSGAIDGARSGIRMQLRSADDDDYTIVNHTGGTINGRNDDAISIATRRFDGRVIINNQGHIFSPSGGRAGIRIDGADDDDNITPVTITNTRAGVTPLTEGVNGVIESGSGGNAISTRAVGAISITNGTNDGSDPNHLARIGQGDDDDRAIDIQNQQKRVTIDNFGTIVARNRGISVALAQGKILKAANVDDDDDVTINNNAGAGIDSRGEGIRIEAAGNDRLVTITNSGSIHTEQAGIRVSNGGDDDDDNLTRTRITNGVGGSINAGGNAVEVHRQGEVTISNHGFIQAGSDGIQVNNAVRNVTIENVIDSSSSSSTDGQLTAVGNAIAVNMSSQDLNGNPTQDVAINIANSGNVTSTSAAGIQVRVQGTRTNVTIQNEGLVKTLNGQGINVQFSDDDDIAGNTTITNGKAGTQLGRIEAASTGINVSRAESDVTITNHGTVDVAHADDDDAVSVSVNQGNVSITNDGQLLGRRGIAVTVNGKGATDKATTIINQATGTIQSRGDSIAVNSNDTRLTTIVNNGTIVSADGVAISLNTPGAVSIVNTGSLRAGTGDDDDDSVIRGNDTGNTGGVTIASKGTISAEGNHRFAINLAENGNAADHVMLGSLAVDGASTAESSTVGNIDLGGGTDRLDFMGTGTLKGDVANVEQITKTGDGTFTWNGSATDATLNTLDISGGTLRIAPPVLAPRGIGPDAVSSVSVNSNEISITNNAVLEVANRANVNAGAQLTVDTGGKFHVESGGNLTTQFLDISNSTGSRVDGKMTLAGNGNDATPKVLEMTDANIVVGTGGLLTVTGDSVLTRSDITVETGGKLVGDFVYVGAGTDVKINQEADGNEDIGDGATLSGTGLIRGTVHVRNGGTLSPGNSPGTLTVVGTLLLDAASTTRIEASNTLNDLINVQIDAQNNLDGKATLAGTLQLVLDNSRSFTTSRTVTIVRSEGGITGNFGTITGASTGAAFNVTTQLVDVAVNNAANPDLLNLVITRNSFAALGLNDSERNVGAVLDQFFASSSSALNPLTNALDKLSAPDLATALNKLDAGTYFSEGQIAVNQSQQTAAQMEQYLRNLRSNFGSSKGPVTGNAHTAAGPIGKAPVPVVASGLALTNDPQQPSSPFADPNSKWGGFGGAYSYEGNQSTLRDGAGQIGQNGFDFSSRGISTGIDHKIRDNAAVGIAFSQGDIKSDLAEGRGRTDADQWQLSTYGTWGKDGKYVDALIAYNNYDFRSLRTVAFPGFIENNRAIHHGESLSGYVGAGWMRQNGGWEWGPTASLQYTNVHLGTIQEVGGVTALTVASREVDSVRSQLGIRAGRRFELSHGTTLVPDIRLRWAHEFSNNDNAITAQFNAGGVAPFSTIGTKPDRDSAFLGASVNAFCKKSLSGFVSYDAEVGHRGLDLHATRAGLNLKF